MIGRGSISPDDLAAEFPLERGFKHYDFDLLPDPKAAELIDEYGPCVECGMVDGEHADDCMAIN